MWVKIKIMSNVYEDETNLCAEKWGSESGSTLNAYYSQSTNIYIYIIIIMIMNTLYRRSAWEYKYTIKQLYR